MTLRAWFSRDMEHGTKREWGQCLISGRLRVVMTTKQMRTSRNTEKKNDKPCLILRPPRVVGVDCFRFILDFAFASSWTSDDTGSRVFTWSARRSSRSERWSGDADRRAPFRDPLLLPLLRSVALSNQHVVPIRPVVVIRPGIRRAGFRAVLVEETLDRVIVDLFRKFLLLEHLLGRIGGSLSRRGRCILRSIPLALFAHDRRVSSAVRHQILSSI